MVSLPQGECLAVRAVEQRAAGGQGQLDVFHVVVELRVLEYRDQSAVVAVFVQRRASFQLPGEVADRAVIAEGIAVVRVKIQAVGLPVVGFLEGGVRHPCAGLGLDAVGAVLAGGAVDVGVVERSEEHTSELQSLMRISYAVFCLKKKKTKNNYL